MKPKHYKSDRYIKAKTFVFDYDGLKFIFKEAYSYVNEYRERKSFPATVNAIGLCYAEHPSIPIKKVKAFIERYNTDPNFREYCDKKFENNDDIRHSIRNGEL